MMRDLYELTLGAIAQPGGGVTFTVWAPRAAQVAVKLLGEKPQIIPMQRAADGTFTAVSAAARPGTEYVYLLDLIDGKKERPDPASRAQPWRPASRRPAVLSHQCRRFRTFRCLRCLHSPALRRSSGADANPGYPFAG